MPRITLPAVFALTMFSGIATADDVRPEDAAPGREEYRYAGKSFGEWVKSMMTELEPSRRLEALKAMKAFGTRGYGKEAPPAILRLVRDHLREFNAGNDEAKVLDTAAETLGSMRATSELLLIDGLKNAHEGYRQFCWTTLFTTVEVSPKSIPVAVDMVLGEDVAIAGWGTSVLTLGIGHDKKEIDEAFARDMAREGRQAALIEKLVGLLSSDNSAEVLGYLGPKAIAATPGILEFVRKNRQENRPGSRSAAALNALRKIGGDADRIVPVVASLLETDDAPTEAIELLGELGPRAKAAARSAVPNMIKYMNDQRPRDRRHLYDDSRTVALKALEKIEPAKSLVPQLVAEFDRNGFAGTWCCKFEIDCLDYFGRQGADSGPAVPLLITRMKSRKGSSVNDISMQQPYVEALGRIGPAAKEALPALREIAAEPRQSGSLKSSAQKAIASIESGK